MAGAMSIGISVRQARSVRRSCGLIQTGSDCRFSALFDCSPEPVAVGSGFDDVLPVGEGFVDESIRPVLHFVGGVVFGVTDSRGVRGPVYVTTARRCNLNDGTG